VPFNAPYSPFQAPEDQLERNKHIENKKRRTFAAMVTSMDDAVGRIVAAANQNLPQGNTLIFFCSDNGSITSTGSNGELRGQKSYTYEAGVRMPAIMVWEGTIKANSIVREPLHITDLYPTILGLVGSKHRQIKALDGKDAWPVITAGEASPHTTILLGAVK
jgi:arylsulfatase A-like enzyme